MAAPKSQMAALLAARTGEEAPPATDAMLAGVLAGERWAHAALYDLLAPVVARTLQKILRDTSGDYEDLVQVSFERIVRTLTGERRAQVSNLPGWAGSIAAHVALDALRGRTRERRLFERGVQSAPRIESVPAPNLERQLEARQKLQWLQSTLARMNADQAQTLLLHDVLGYGLAEIASIMGVSEAAAQRRLSRGHQELLRRAALRGHQGAS
ncbi:MAG TPA: RNA polymerase sigma factor [Polyangiaceae bacterium]|nr:RNA polymerase sigma factor [Polyangiaceae bacterium]